MVVTFSIVWIGFVFYQQLFIVLLLKRKKNESNNASLVVLIFVNNIRYDIVKLIGYVQSVKYSNKLIVYIKCEYQR